MKPGTQVTIRATGQTGTITGHTSDQYGRVYAVNVDGRRTWHRAGELKAVKEARE